uniref:Uncharacterized protein n=1 Tax=Anguilla anguilla TaxID=7936 RepID=A0A0E9Y1E1_ANGAN
MTNFTLIYTMAMWCSSPTVRVTNNMVPYGSVEMSHSMAYL